MVDYRVVGDVAVLEVNNPPVNALCFEVRDGLEKGLERASTDDKVETILICGRGTFIAGADIKEFGTGENLKYPTITDLTFLIEDSKKPVVAAIHGFALGGGLEIALGCHYRIGHLKSQYGFPEVEIGILPGATGTQRLPRVSGLKAALDIIPTARRIDAKEALQIGVLDRVSHHEDILPDALAFARSVAHKSLAGRHTSKGPVIGAENAQILMQEALAKVKKRTPGQIAPIYNIKAVMDSALCSREEGLEKETMYAIQLGTSYQSRALQYAFFAQRAAPKWEIPGASYKTVKPQKLQTGAVVGAGTMGTGIAVCMLNAGMPVVLVEQNKKLLDMGVASIRNLYAGSVRLGKSTQAQADKCLSMLKPALDYTDLRDVDLVIEAVYENMEVKKEVFKKLDEACKPETLLWTNTSALNVDEIAMATRRPDKVIGAHFFVPAYHMKLLENVRGEKSSPHTIATAMEFGTKIGKVPVLVGNCYGFVGNRMQGPMTQEATFLLEEGSSPQEIDQVHENMGFPLGIFKVKDLSGGDIGWLQRKAIAKQTNVQLTQSTRYLKGTRYTYIPDLLCEKGRFGRKTGKGFYRYEKPHAKVPFVDPYVTDLILNFCAQQGIKRRKITPQEIHERLYYSLINEGFKILEQGFASKPEDIDTIWLLGYSWPRYYGGPMFYSNMVGVKKIYERVCHYYRLYPASPHWQPSELMRRVAENDVPMKKWKKYIPSNSRL